MAKAKLHTPDGAYKEDIELPASHFDQEVNEPVMFQAAYVYLGNQRQGTHKVKTRAEVQGASRKLHRQKGTGGARKGNIRNPLYKGGGTIFGPKPHGYDFKLNRKVKDLAKISALSHKAKSGSLFIVEDLKLDTPRTKDVAAMLDAIKVSDKKALLVAPDYNETLLLSARNIPSVLTALLADLNTYDLVNADVLVLTEDAAKIFTEEENAVEA